MWQTNLTGSTQDLIGLQEQAGQARPSRIAAHAGRGRRLPGNQHPAQQSGSLRSLFAQRGCCPTTPLPTRKPSRCLEQVVELDPNYAPAWAELGQRYYYDATYSNGGEQMFQHSNAALERALALDPNLIAAASQLIVNRVDRGELGKAYESAAALVKRRPENAQAHFTLGYVQRYAGMLEESARQCDTALTLAPGNYQFRSCAWAFMELGKFDRATRFHPTGCGLGMGQLRDAFSAAARRQGRGGPRSGEAHADCSPLPSRSPGSLPGTAAAVGTGPHGTRRRNQPAFRPGPGDSLTIRGRFSPTAARRMRPSTCSRPAIEQNYCAYSNLLSDPAVARPAQRSAVRRVADCGARLPAGGAGGRHTARATDSGRIEQALAANSSFPAQSISI